MKYRYLSFLFGLSLMPMTQVPMHADAPKTDDGLAPLDLVEQVPMPKVAGRIDHIDADTKRHRLYISALGNDTVEVVDYGIGKWIYSISGLNQPKGVLYLPDFGKLFVVNKGDGTLKIFDDTFSLLKAIDIGTHVDYLHYNKTTKKILVGVSEGSIRNKGSLMVIDPATNAQVGNIPLDGPPEDFAIESNGNRIWVNIYDTNFVDSVDTKTGQVTKWTLDNAQKPVPMAFDEAGHRIFVISRIPPVMVILDSDTGKEISRIPVGGICADLIFDAEKKRIYAINGSGYISVFQQKDPDHYDLIDTVHTVLGARSGYFFPWFHRVFLAAPDIGNGPAKILEYQTP